MLVYILFISTVIVQVKSNDCTSLIKSGGDVSICLVPKTNYLINYQGSSVPCFLTSTSFSSEINAKVPFQYYINLKQMLQSQIRNFSMRNKQFSRKIDFILQQLEKYPLSQINLLVQLEEIVQFNEKIETLVRKYFPPLIFFFNLWQSMLDFEYDYKYKYLPIFEAYHDLCLLYRTGKPFLIRGQITTQNETIIQKISSADENSDDASHRCSSQIYNMIENWEQTRMDHEDPFPILSLLCLEFENAIDNRINQEGEDENIKTAREQLANNVDYFVSHSSNLEYYNLLGINIKIVMKTFVTPKNGGSKISVIYLNREQFKSFKEQLPDEKFNLFEIANLAFYAMDALNYWRYGSLMKALALSYIPKNLLDSVRNIFDPNHIPGWKECLHKVNYFTSMLGINLEKGEEQNMNNFEYKKNQEKGRKLMKKFLNEIPDLNCSYLVRIEIPENERYTISIIPFL